MTSDVPHQQRLAEFTAALDHMNEVVTAVPAERWSSPSPCADWTAAQVLDHVTGTVTKATGMLTGADSYGGSPAEASTDAQGALVTDAWTRALEALSDALPGADLSRIVESPQGPSTLSEALAFPTSDLAVHSWDLAAAAGLPRELPPGMLAQVRRTVEVLPDAVLRRDGLFGPAVEVDARSSETDKLMAWLGRRVQ